MSRVAWVLTALVVVLLSALWFFVVWSPTSQEIEDVRAEIERVESQTLDTQRRAAQLREIRDNAPEAAADLALADVLIPREPALPALLRQLQTAADESGVRLVSVSPSRPASVTDAPAGLSALSVTMTIEGSYFQIVDLARRLEDPAIMGRGLQWGSVTMSENEYPALTVQLSAQVFSRLAGPVPDAPADDAAADETDEDATDEADDPVVPDAPDAPPADSEEDVL